jgi:DNA-directed RNA polymerase specialized sigma24 family protein
VTILEVKAITRIRLWQHDRNLLRRGTAVDYRRQGWQKRGTALYDARLVRVVDFERVLESLAPEDQQLIILAHCEQRTARETAAIVGAEESTARRRTDRALARLAIALDRAGLLP